MAFLFSATYISIPQNKKVIHFRIAEFCHSQLFHQIYLSKNLATLIFILVTHLTSFNHICFCVSVTFCDKIPRKICAPDNCRVVEDSEQCQDNSEQSTIEEPIELCDLQPQKHCSQVKVSVPRLVPERKCRQVEKEICNTQLVNPHDIKKPVIIKYCTKKERVKSSNSYLPPPPPSSPAKAFDIPL